ncbi:MAG: GerW family sporulation protein [Oscillospiraceae bacterium]
METNDKKQPIRDILDSSLQNLKQLVDVNTIIGDAITTPDGITIIPVSKVTFGFTAGGSEWPTAKPNTPFGGGSGGGVTIQPLAFLVIAHGDVTLLPVQSADSTADRVVNMMPGVIDKVSGILQKSAAKKAAAQPEPPSADDAAHRG